MNTVCRPVLRLPYQLMIIVLACTLAACQPSEAQDKQDVIDRVIDGDTFYLEDLGKVRLIGIDTPEGSDNKKARRQSKRTGESVRAMVSAGRAVSRQVRDCLEGLPVEVQFGSQAKDDYGRWLVYLFVEAPRRGCDIPPAQWIKKRGQTRLFVNASMIDFGWAKPLMIKPNLRYIKWFKTMSKDAKQAKRGVWRELSDF